MILVGTENGVSELDGGPLLTGNRAMWLDARSVLTDGGDVVEIAPGGGTLTHVDDATCFARTAARALRRDRPGSSRARWRRRGILRCGAGQGRLVHAVGRTAGYTLHRRGRGRDPPRERPRRGDPSVPRWRRDVAAHDRRRRRRASGPGPSDQSQADPRGGCDRPVRLSRRW